MNFKWAMFVRFKGVWRFEGFLENDQKLIQVQEDVERVHGKGTFRAHLFQDL